MSIQHIELDVNNNTPLSGFINILGELVHVTPTEVFDGILRAETDIDVTAAKREFRKVSDLQRDDTLAQVDGLELVAHDEGNYANYLGPDGFTYCVRLSRDDNERYYNVRQLITD